VIMNESIWNEEDNYTEESASVEQGAELSFGLNPEVVQRIEKAKLYEALLKQPLFGEGGTSSEMIQDVEYEVRSFVVSRIELLMGLRQENTNTTAKTSEFTSDEVKALKALASKVLGKPTSNPTVQAAQVPSQPSVKTVQVRHSASPKRPANTTIVPSAPTKPTRRRKSSNVSSTGQDLSQATSAKALPMPSHDQINAHVSAQQASLMSKGKVFVGDDPSSSGTNGGTGVDLASILAAAIKNNPGE
jgi:hypothetical protein